jgi:Leucine-rich repeat (LRR) protein
MNQTFIEYYCAQILASSLPAMPLLQSIKFDDAAGKPVAAFLTAFCAPSAAMQTASHPNSSSPPVASATAATSCWEREQKRSRPTQKHSRPMLKELILKDITFKLCKQAPKKIEVALQSLDLSCLSRLMLDFTDFTTNVWSGIISPVGELPSLLHLHCGQPRYEKTPPPATALSSLLAGAKKLQHLDLHLDMPAADWQTVAPAVAALPSLTHFSASGFFPVAPAGGAADEIPFLSYIRELSVNDPCLRGVGGEDVCSTLRGLKSLERFEMSGLTLNPTLGNAVIEALATITSLMHVQLHTTVLGGGAAILSALHTLPKLQNLNLQDTKLFIFRRLHDAFSATLDALSSRLTSLNLSRCGIADEDLVSLGPSLARMTRLRELDIIRNHFNAKSFAKLISQVSCLTQLENFRFENDDEQCDNDAAVNDGLCALTAFLPQLQVLTHLQSRPTESLNQIISHLKHVVCLLGRLYRSPLFGMWTYTTAK